jgi:nitrite reductase/ring-hydroxylating ferredoxin subunit
MAATVGKMDDVPAGSVVSFQIEGKQVAVANVDGRSSPSTTRAPLGCPAKDREGTSITCPCHGSVFQ